MNPSRTRIFRYLLTAACMLVFAIGAQSASAVTLSPTPCPLLDSNFQGGDGNQLNESAHCPTAADPATAFIDWQGLQADSRTLDFNELPDSDLLHPGADSTFAGGNKETDLTNWKINFPTMQVTPNKDNLFAAWEALAKGSSGNAAKFLYLALSREVNTGDTHLEFELNQKPVDDNWTNSVGQSVPCRTNGDLLISYEVASGGSPPNVTVVVYTWTSSTFAPANSGPLGSLCGATGTFTPHDPGAANAEGAINKDDLANPSLNDPSGNSTFAAGTFGEAALNLPGIFQAAGEGTCTNFGQMAVHSRSSTSIDSQLQDVLGPAPILIPSCTITTSATTNVPVGSNISDTATVSLAYQPSNLAQTEVDFTAYDDAACTHSVFTDTKTPTQQQNGNLTATSSAYTTVNAGTYYWQATFVDNHNGVHVTGTCGDQTHGNQEQSVVNPKQPTVTTTAQTNVTVGTGGAATITDQATLSGGTSNAGGTLTFRVYSNSDCAANHLLATASPTTPVNAGANGHTYTSSPVTVSHAGTYYWSVQYSGDNTNNLAIAETTCGLQTGGNQERSVVNPRQPTVTTTAQSPVTIGADGTATIHDSATLSGGTDGATGTLTFRVYSNSDCAANHLVATASPTTPVDAGANGHAYQSADVTVSHAGTYYWSVQYSGDNDNNLAIAETTCGLQTGGNQERSVVNPRQPTVTTTAQTNVTIGTDGTATINDSATLSGGTDGATGTLTFRVYSNSDCAANHLVATASPTTPVNAGANGHTYTSANVTVSHAGTYYWSVQYSGDNDNNLAIAETNCGLQTGGNQERSVVNPRQPSVTTHAINASIGADGTATIHDSATLSGGTSNAGGTLTFRVYSNSDCAANHLVATADPTTAVNAGANGHTYQSADVVVSSAGTYYWSVQYSGDNDNNQPIAETTCGIHNETNEERSVVSPVQPSISTTLSDTQVDTGATVHDSAQLTGATSNAGGQVTYTVYTDSKCSQNPQDAGTVDVSGGDVPDSNAIEFDQPGTYYWQAVYTGDVNNGGATSTCTEEQLTVVGLGIEKHADDNFVEVGSQVGFVVTVSGSGPAQGVTLNDPLPSGPSGNTLDWSIPSGGVTGDVTPDCSISGAAGSQTLTCDAVDLGTGSHGETAQSYTVHLVSATNPNGPGFTIKNVATATAKNDGSVTDDDTAEGDTNPTAPGSGNTIVVSALSIKKTADAAQVETGNPIGFKIAVTGSGPANDVTLNDPLPAGPSSNQTNWSIPSGGVTGDVSPNCSVTGVAGSQALHCDAVNLGGGQDGSTPQSYTVHVVSPTAAGGSAFTANNTATASSSNHGDVHSSDTVGVHHPAIAIDKTGPATGLAGDKIGYVLTVTNPGQEPLTGVSVTDQQCNGDPVALIGKGGDGSPDTLDPGDVWTYSCSVQTAVGDTAVHNTATANGCDQLGGCVNANDSADTTLSQPQQIVSPGRVTPGAARLSGPTGCVAKAFNARVRGTKIATVTFVLDGKVVKKVKNTKHASLIQLRINPSKMRLGVHRLVVNVTFQSGSGTKPKTIRLSFQRCAKKLAQPRFTG